MPSENRSEAMRDADENEVSVVKKTFNERAVTRNRSFNCGLIVSEKLIYNNLINSHLNLTFFNKIGTFTGELSFL